MSALCQRRRGDAVDQSHFRVWNSTWHILKAPADTSRLAAQIG